MKKILWSEYIILIIIVTSCKSVSDDTQGKVYGHITEKGVIDCFEEGLTNSKGELLFCETSAVVFDGKNLIFANDHNINPHSAVFSVAYQNGKVSHSGSHYFNIPEIMHAIKYEGLTETPDGKYIIATTGFDRIKEHSSEWDAYNTLLIWPVDYPNAVKVVSPTTSDSITSSISLREKISRVLKTDQFPGGVPYFKIEGICVIPDNQLLFGIRELGASYEDFNYAIKIISVSYQINDGELFLNNEFKLAYEYDASKHPELKHTIGLSDMTYDKYHDCLYILTSYEGDKVIKELGGFLWELPIEDFFESKAPNLVLEDNGWPVRFSDKAEGITVLNDKQLFIISDDDKVVDSEQSQISNRKKANQAAYIIIEMR